MVRFGLNEHILVMVLIIRNLKCCQMQLLLISSSKHTEKVIFSVVMYICRKYHLYMRRLTNAKHFENSVALTFLKMLKI